MNPQAKEPHQPPPLMNAIYTTAAIETRTMRGRSPTTLSIKYQHHQPATETQCPLPQLNARLNLHPQKTHLQPNLIHLNIQPASITTT